VINNVEKSKPTGKLILRVGLSETMEIKKDGKECNDKIKSDQTEVFTKEDLRIIWKNYANELSDKHLKSIILYLNPELKENYTIEILALNPEQIQYIQQNSDKITSYLSLHLKNNQIKLDIKMKENDTKESPFTAQEKYTYMADKNPLLKKLVQEFSLRLD
jgi:DNA polymerase-3 subunit gamma/tau